MLTEKIIEIRPFIYINNSTINKTDIFNLLLEQYKENKIGKNLLSLKERRFKNKKNTIYNIILTIRYQDYF